MGAPITAELLQAYLSSTGAVFETIAAIVFLAPIYGGTALLIREVAVRRQLGWAGIVLLGTAFGIVMPGVVDLALFGVARPDIVYWTQMREPTLIAPLGISGFTTMMWVVGHAVMSIAAPLAVQHALVPAVRGQPLLGRAGISVCVLAATGCGLLVHLDGRRIYGYTPTLGQVCGVLTVAALVTACAFTRFGRPVTRRRHPSRAVPAVAVVSAAFVAKSAFDLLPWTWGGVVAGATVVAIAVLGIRRLATTRQWGPREIGLLGAGAITSGATLGFINPTPEGISTMAKLVQNTVLLAVALLLSVVVAYRTRGLAAPRPAP